jgi:hypothetical protein
MDVLSDSSLFSNAGEVTTKEILKRFEGRIVNGVPRQYETSEFVGRQDNKRPFATRVDTDPAVYQTESSVRPVQQDPTIPFSTPQGTPPQKRRDPDYGQGPNQYEREPQGSEHPENGQRREWRQSAWGRKNSIPTGTG